jgi:hypothetical protein
MSISRKILSVFMFIFFLAAVLSFGQQAEEKPVKIPKEVTQVIETNLAARQAQLDIPLSYTQTLYFPYQQDYFTVFFLKAKNQDLGYQSPFMGEEEETEEESEEEESILTCQVDFFFRVYSLGEGGEIKGVHKEIYLPYADQMVASDFNPEEENSYSFGTLFPPGRYLMAAASANLDLSRIGLVFQEFYLPSDKELKKDLTLTPLFFVKNMSRMPSADTVINIYKNVFHYATLEIEPYFDHEFSLKEKLDVFYFILGATPSREGKFSFDVSYIYKKGEEVVLKFEPQALDNIPAPIVSLPLPLLFGEKNLEPGEYTLEINIKDKVKNKEGSGTINFKIGG